MRRFFASLLLLVCAPLLAQVPVVGSTVNATQGFKYQGGAASNTVLCGNGTAYVPSSTCGASASYQVIQGGGVAYSPRFATNYDAAYFIVTDDPGNNRTNVTLTGVCKSDGTNCPSQSATCNANGCYVILADGTLDQWGSVSVPPTGTGTNSASFTFPHSFTSTTNLSVVVTTVGLASNSGDPSDPPGVQLSSVSTTGGSAFMARFIQASEGGGHFDNTITLMWQAKGK